MSVTVTFTPTNADLARASYLGIRSRPVVFAVFLGFFVAVPWGYALTFLAWKLAGRHVPWEPIAGLAITPAISVVAFTLIPVLMHRRARTLHGPRAYEFTDEEIRAIGPGFDTRIQWGVLTHCLMHSFGLLLTSGRTPIVTVPGRALSDSGWRELRLLMQAKGLKLSGPRSGA
jgi:hypothetical protein